MTTIVADARAGVMVSDSKCTGNGSWMPMTKIFRVNGDLFGFAGDVYQREKWLKWHRGGRKGPRPKLDSFEGLLLKVDGTLYELCSDGLEMLVERGYHAVGSGGPAALGAMLAGKGAQEAVQIACLVDASTGGDVVVFELKEKAQ